MINYELAKQLYKNGTFKSSIPVTKANEKYLDYPPLSELIEACGGSFDVLQRWEWNDLFPSDIKEVASICWRAYPTEEAYKGDCVVDCCGYETGDTPEEAVAKLWLQLNKK